MMYRTAWDNNFWLQVDYLQLANAALNVSSYYTCLLYIEVWAEITRFAYQYDMCRNAAERIHKNGAPHIRIKLKSKNITYNIRISV